MKSKSKKNHINSALKISAQCIKSLQGCHPTASHPRFPPPKSPDNQEQENEQTEKKDKNKNLTGERRAKMHRDSIPQIIVQACKYGRSLMPKSPFESQFYERTIEFSQINFP